MKTVIFLFAAIGFFKGSRIIAVIAFVYYGFLTFSSLISTMTAFDVLNVRLIIEAVKLVFSAVLARGVYGAFTYHRG